jgi:acetyl-CoA C-acetyltransferase
MATFPPVAILGLAARCTSGETVGNLEEAITETASAALDSAGLDRDAVGAVVLAASDQTDGRAISSMLTAGPAGAFLVDEINLASSPGHALATACLAILSGQHRRMLVTSWGKASEIAVEGGAAAAERLSTDPVYERDAALAPAAALGLQAGAHRASAGGAEAAAHAVVVRNRAAAGRNERAVVRDPVTRSEIEASPIAAFPVRELELPATCDGVFSLVVAAASSDPHAATIRGVGWSADSSSLGARDLLGLPHLRAAAADAYARAGIRDPRRELDLCELQAGSGDAEVLSYEALGLCDYGHGIRCAQEDGGDLPINPSGGSYGGEAPFGGGLRPVVEAALQVSGRAGAVQVPGAGRALAQVATGLAGQFQTVFVLEAGR